MEAVVDTEQDVGSVRSPIDLDALDTLFSKKAAPDGIVLGGKTQWSPLQPPLAVKQFKFGQSNPTYLLIDSQGRKAVLRRKPSANAQLISRNAHAIEREFYMIDAIGKIGADIPIAQPYLLCEDEHHIGAVFYVMEFVKGRIFHDPSMSTLSERERKLTWESVVETLVAIHSVAADKLFEILPESHFRWQSKVKSSGYFARQVKSLSRIQRLQATTVYPIPHFDKISRWLASKAPDDPQPSPLIHGDFKIDNLVLHPTEPKVIAVLDWELCTNGHPLFDLANVLQPFTMPLEMNRVFAKFDIHEDPKLVSTVLERYKAVANNSWDPVAVWDVGVVFALYRVGVITQGIAQRVVKGVASSAQARKTGSLFPLVGNFANRLTNNGRL